MMHKNGILLPLFALDGDYGIGTIGRRAYEFVDVLRLTGQGIWQILPTGPVGYGHSPYQSTSSYAGNPLLIDLELLVEQGLLSWVEISPLYESNTGKVDYHAISPIKQQILKLACDHFSYRASVELQQSFQQFCQQHDDLWLHDYALFELISQEYNAKPWYEWAPALRDRDAQSLARVANENAEALQNIKIEQFLFDQQWRQLHAYCRQSGIELIGDIPLFVAHNSVDAWCYRSLFYFNREGQCTVVAGVPPDYFSDTGQRWGNPLYRWSTHEVTQFKWWFQRLDYMLERLDLLRIDHFRGLESYWQIQSSEDSAINGQWQSASGQKLLSAYFMHNPKAQFIAEDLGVITPEVEALRDQFDLPGMKVLQFGFDGQATNLHLPQNYPENSVAYSSTHDNDTLVGWLNSEANHHHIATALSLSHEAINHWRLIYAVMNSRAKRTIFPIQDVLGLDTHARMNTPSVVSDENWSWRLKMADFSLQIQTTLYDCTVLTKRCQPIV